MSPELLDQDHSSFGDGRPTKGSDCYALGMVILEILSGQPPFARYSINLIVIQKIVRGEHPERPEGTRFTDDLWRTVELCWAFQPRDRPTLEAILECLGRASASRKQLFLGADSESQSDVDKNSRPIARYPRMFPCCSFVYSLSINTLYSRSNTYRSRYPAPAFTSRPPSRHTSRLPSVQTGRYLPPAIPRARGSCVFCPRGAVTPDKRPRLRFHSATSRHGRGVE